MQSDAPLSDLRGRRTQTAKHNPIGLTIGVLIVLGATVAVGDYVWKTWPQPRPQPVVADTRLPST